MSESESFPGQQEIAKEAAPEYSAEKTPAQREILRRAMQHIQERMEALGVPFHGFDDKQFIFLDSFRTDRTGQYSSESDQVILQAFSEANLASITHEALHYISSEYYAKGKEETLQARLNSRRKVRSGFHGVFYATPTDTDPQKAKASFRDLNEAVTEKMAREIVEKILKSLKHYVHCLQAERSNDWNY